MTVKLSGPMLPPRSGKAPTQLMVLLHGYGADGGDLIGLGRHWGEMLPGMLFVSPNAPSVCDHMPSGFQWFPVAGALPIRKVGDAEAARPALVNFLMDLWAQTGVSPAKTVLAGFSQGGMMALHVGTALDQQLAGLISFSGAFLPPEGFGTGKFAKPPVALIHGDQDGVVDTDLSRQAATVLRAAGLDVTLHISPGVGHGIAEDGLEFATAFLLATMGGKGQ